MNKLLSKVGLALLAVVILTGCDACDSGGGIGSPVRSWIDDIDWSSHSGMNAGFIADNLSSYNLVAFAGSVTRGNVLGGIPAQTDNHGVHRNSTVFDRTRTVVVVLVTEDDLRRHDAAGTLAALNAEPFSSIMVFYNHNMLNNHRNRISERPGGRHRFIVTNMTDHNVEFRINSSIAGGEGILGFAQRNTTGVVFHLTDPAPPALTTTIFPVFRFFHPVNQVVSEIVPRWRSGYFQGLPYFRTLATGAANPAVNTTLNVQDLLADFDMELGAVWLRVVNTSQDVIFFFQGNEAMYSSMDTFPISSAMPNNHQTHVFPARATDSAPAEPITVANLGIGPDIAVRTTNVTDSEGGTTFTLQPDHRYTITVTGSITGGFTATIALPGTPVSIQELLNDREQQ